MSRSIRKASRWQKIRKFFQDIHLWMGLTGGLVLIVVCFTGTVYVFNTELTEAAAPELYKVAYQGTEQRLPLDSLVGMAEAASGGRAAGIRVSDDPRRSLQVFIRKEGDKARSGQAWFVDPYRGTLLGGADQPNAMRDFMSAMFSLHRWLLLDKVDEPIITGLDNRKLGSYITGTATILFTIGCLTGLIIWFPPRVRNWRQGLKIKWRAGWKRVNHDLHNTLAFYSLLFLLLMGLTGPQWSFPWYREGMQKLLGVYREPAPREQSGRNPVAAMVEAREPKGERAPSGTKPPASLDEVLATMRTALPYTGEVHIGLQDRSLGTYTGTKTRTGFFAPAAGDKIVVGTDGKLRSLDRFRDKPFNERVAGSIKAIHVGSVYGGFTKILYFLACLVATSLPVTGTLIWVNKLKQRRRPLRVADARVAA